MVLVDTSVWVNHLQSGDPELRSLLEGEQVLVHPFVIGELACGTLRNRSEILALLHALPYAVKAGDDEALAFVEERSLAGKGLGWIDVHLLASALLSKSLLWTADRRMAAIATQMSVEYEPSGR